MRNLRKKVSIAFATALTLALIQPAYAKANERSIVKQCSMGNSFEFSVDWEPRRVDFDFDIERGDPRESWKIRIERNDATLINRQLKSDEDGDVSREFVRRGQITSNEKWTFVARSESGNICRATIRF